MNYEEVKSFLGNPNGFSNELLEQVFSELQAKTYGRFVPFFTSQVMKCCTLENVWKPLIVQKISFLNALKGQHFMNPDDVKSLYSSSNGGSSGSIDGISFNDSSQNNLDADKYLGHINTSMTYLDKQIHYAIRRYSLDSQLIGSTNYMCGKCPNEDPSCNDCGCEEFWAGNCGCQ